MAIKLAAWRFQYFKNSWNIFDFVPTVDTVRNAYVTEVLVMFKKHTLLVGDTGTGKTVLALRVAEELRPATARAVAVKAAPCGSLNASTLGIESLQAMRQDVSAAGSG